MATSRPERGQHFGAGHLLLIGVELSKPKYKRERFAGTQLVWIDGAQRGPARRKHLSRLDWLVRLRAGHSEQR